MSMGEELQKLHELHQSGALSGEEFARAKARLLDSSPAAANREGVLPAVESVDPEALEREARLWGLLLHLSLFAGYLIPLAGLVAPILIWQLKKNELPRIDQHGKNVTNWIISHLIYFVGCLVLIVAIIGIPLLVALGVVSIVFPIVGAIKANNGEVWKYPLSIPFFK
jgi:uncharacterized protein